MYETIYRIRSFYPLLLKDRFLPIQKKSVRAVAHYDLLMSVSHTVKKNSALNKLYALKKNK